MSEQMSEHNIVLLKEIINEALRLHSLSNKDLAEIFTKYGIENIYYTDCAVYAKINLQCCARTTLKLALGGPTFIINPGNVIIDTKVLTYDESIRIELVTICDKIPSVIENYSIYDSNTTIYKLAD